jgi:hypothetical protein
MSEKVDILIPPLFKKSGVVKTKKQALIDQDWLGSFHLWIVQTKPFHSLLFQERSQASTFAGKLDITAAGHLKAGETAKDGLREVKEEIGKNYKLSDLTYLGRKIFVGIDKKVGNIHTISSVYMLKDNSPLNTFKLQKLELSGLCRIRIDDLINVFTHKDYTFQARCIDNRGNYGVRKLFKDNFIENWDNYQLKIAHLAKDFIKGKKCLHY